MAEKKVKSKQLEKKLNFCAVGLLRSIEVDALFWNSAIKHGAISQGAVSEYIRAGETNADKIDRLLNHIRKDIIVRYDGLIKALVDTNQRGPLEVLKETQVLKKLQDQEDTDKPVPIVSYSLVPVPGTEDPAAPAEGRLLFISEGECANDIAWMPDGALLVGRRNISGSVERILFSADYTKATSSSILLTGDCVCRISSGPLDAWAICNDKCQLKVHNNENIKRWDTQGLEVTGVALSQEKVIFCTPTSLHVCNERGGLLFTKEVTSDAIQFMTYRQDDCIVFTTGQAGSEQALCMVELNETSRPSTVTQFGENLVRNFKCIGGVACDKHCNSYVIDHGASEVHVFTKDMRYLWALQLVELERLTDLRKLWTLSIFDRPSGGPILAVCDGVGGNVLLYELY